MDLRIVTLVAMAVSSPCFFDGEILFDSLKFLSSNVQPAHSAISQVVLMLRIGARNRC